jgi:signal transduction histidine kinase
LRNSNDFKFDITVAFVIFAFLIVVSVTYTAIYIFTNLTTEEFKDKVKLAANNMYFIYKQKEDTIKDTTIALSKNDIFNTDFHINPLIIKSVFKTMLYANENIQEINFYNRYGKLNIGCEKVSKDVVCYENNRKLNIIDFDKNNLFFKENLKQNGIVYIAITPIENKQVGFIEVKALIKFPNKENTFYNYMIIDKNGKIFYSTSPLYHAKTIYDLYNYFLADRLMKLKEGFISDDIYVKTFSPNIKAIFIQNKSVISKTNKASQRMALIMIIISIFVAIPLGIFFSRPLYKFYEELDKRVKEEIEKRQQKEQLLMHQSKLAALGEMLGNIAHQWRHPLTRLSLLIQNLEIAFNMKKLDKERFEKFKENALMQINYMSETIDDFTNFFKKDTKKVEFCPKEIIEDALKLIDARIKQNKVEVQLDIKKTEPIYGYKTEFSQVILNIINNAIDILKERNIENKKIWIRIDGKKIEIEDNAGGIPENIKDKIFEPYFTTKFQSQGTGIGLYMSRVIITQHFNGKLYAYNSKNGAVFVIELV